MTTFAPVVVGTAAVATRALYLRRRLSLAQARRALTGTRTLLGLTLRSLHALLLGSSRRLRGPGARTGRTTARCVLLGALTRSFRALLLRSGAICTRGRATLLRCV